MTTMPGFAHDYPFDPTYGYDESGLLAIEPPLPPDDFEAFWKERYARAVAIPPRPSRRATEVPGREDLELYEVEYDALGLGGEATFRVGGWLLVPRQAEPVRCEVVGHGYGGRPEPALDLVEPPAARLFVCKRGFHRSARPDLPDTSEEHVLHGIGSRETYVHLGNAADLWGAVSALVEWFPHLADRIDYTGGSFGGGIGALAMPWESRVRRVHLDVPSFGNHPLRLTMRCRGSGEAVRLYHQAHPEVAEVLRYFDAAGAARFMRQPTLVSVARFDPAVPPPGQFSVFNALPGSREILIRDGGHFEYPDLPRDREKLRRAMAAWFSV